MSDPLPSRNTCATDRRAGLFGLVAVLICTGALAQTPNVAAEPAVRFEIGGYRLSGNTLVDAADIAPALAPFVGPDKDFADIQKALGAIRAAYARVGYRGVAVSLPEQELDSGTVRIAIVEPVVEKVEIAGNGHFDGVLMRGYFPMLEEGKPVDFDRLGRALDVVNQNPALKATVEIAPGSREAARTARIAVTDENPQAYFAALDNSGTAATGKHRLTAGSRHADVAGLGHVLTAQYSVSVEKPADVSFWGLGYRLPLPAEGTSLEFFAGHSDAHSGTVADLFHVAGKGSIFGAKAIRQLDRVGAYRHRIAAGIDYHAFENSVVPVGGSQSVVPDYTVHPVVVSYAAEYGNAAGSISLLRGFRGAADSDGATLDRVRSGAGANYAAVRFAGSYVQPFANGWMATFGLDGQHAGDPLVPGEQFGLGGARSVRGFDERHIAGDSGHRVSLEAYTPQGEYGELRLKGVGFVDWGELRRNNVQPAEPAVEAVAAWGLGVRAGLTKHVSIVLDAAKVLRGTAAHAAGSRRIHLSIQMVL